MSDGKLDKLADAVQAVVALAGVEGCVFAAVLGDEVITAGLGPKASQEEAASRLMELVASPREEGELDDQE
jgi:hypothetical protein